MKKLPREFFKRKPDKVARDLLGKLLVRKKDGKIWVGKIVEAEAYLGPGDRASHSHRGMTPRNEVMFGPAGVAYIYFTYGMHWLLNFITEEEGKASGVLVRAVEPLYSSEEPPEKRVAAGPAKLTKWMEINGDLNKTDITKSEELFVAYELKIGVEKFSSKRLTGTKIMATARVGVDYAGADKDLLLRFYIKDNSSVSRI
jgi:DNA-3-methyladenine glycosylase